jgi:REP element-mobilizing transposase RayT
VFASVRAATAAVGVLHELVSMADVPVYAYCVMPDHVHIVLGPSATCDIITFVGRFKNLAQRAAWEAGVEGAFWQVGFYDHLLRVEEDIEQVVRYVLDNPVRAGLVSRAGEYRFSGSPVFEEGP